MTRVQLRNKLVRLTVKISQPGRASQLSLLPRTCLNDVWLGEQPEIWDYLFLTFSCLTGVGCPPPIRNRLSSQWNFNLFFLWLLLWRMLPSMQPSGPSPLGNWGSFTSMLAILLLVFSWTWVHFRIMYFHWARLSLMWNSREWTLLVRGLVPGS